MYRSPCTSFNIVQLNLNRISSQKIFILMRRFRVDGITFNSRLQARLRKSLYSLNVNMSTAFNFVHWKLVFIFLIALSFFGGLLIYEGEKKGHEHGGGKYD